MTRILQKAFLLMTLLSLALIAAQPAQAAADPQAPSQQDKMKACNNLADNKGLKGDDRKNFMQDCLSKTGSQPLDDMSQKDKLDACKNLADKKNLKGDDRRSFLKDCMNKVNHR
jgi:hypothetical protein